MLEIVVIGAAVFGVVAYALGRVGGLTPVVPDDGDDGLPAGRLAPDAIDRARFGLAFRGYRMGEVDRVLDRLRDELSARDAELADPHPDDALDTPGAPGACAAASSTPTIAPVQAFAAPLDTGGDPAPVSPPSSSPVAAVRAPRPRGAHARPAGTPKPPVNTGADLDATEES